MIKKKKSLATKGKQELSSLVLRELKIIKTEIRDLNNEDMFTKSRIRVLQNQLKDESSLIREQNLEFKDEILNEIRAMREELTVTLGQYTRHEEILEDHKKRITSLEQPKFT